MSALSHKLLKKKMKFNMNLKSDNKRQSKREQKPNAKIFSNSTDKIISGFSRSYQEETRKNKKKTKSFYFPRQAESKEIQHSFDSNMCMQILYNLPRSDIILLWSYSGYLFQSSFFVPSLPFLHSMNVFRFGVVEGFGIILHSQTMSELKFDEMLFRKWLNLRSLKTIEYRNQ